MRIVFSSYSLFHCLKCSEIADDFALVSQATGAQLMGRSAASPSAGTSFDNTTASPLPYANSPRSGTNMNTPSPQQQSQQQQQQHHQHQLLQQQQQQQRPKMMPLSQHPQQLLTQQQFRQSAMPGLGQLHGQPQMQQFSQALGTHQQFQGRQMASGIGQSQLGQGNPMTRHLSQFSSAANSALFNAAQTTQNTQMIPNMSGTMPSQSLLQSRMQRTHPSQLLNDQMFNMGGANPTGMLPIQQQGTSQSAFGNMQQPNAQSLQANMVALQNNPQNHHPNFSQQRPQNQQ
ncbi:hypothetical protein CRG98_003674 [Punica granatum]|uniref:Mediator of RNA polymerase II transcription subunit 8-like n=1 Tax=Punica granatum TaxID=22663 RepID=A0A2I0L5Q2_PUNGR|nr:hypothetical protein CRG98_003674 [Punica granatum]